MISFGMAAGSTGSGRRSGDQDNRSRSLCLPSAATFEERYAPISLPTGYILVAT